MDALTRKHRVKYSKRNARIESPYHVFERLIALDLKLQQIENQNEEQTKEQAKNSVNVSAEYKTAARHFAMPVAMYSGKISTVCSVEDNMPLRRIHIDVNGETFALEIL